MAYRINLLFLFLFTVYLSKAQSFQEICPSSTTNGTIVNCEYYNDTLYATGFFNVICDLPVGYVAKWNEGEWQSTSINITDPGHALKAINDKLYIARYEQSIDSNWVYVYDGNSLEKLGNGVYLTTASGFSELPNIYDIVEYNGNIVACGEFDRVGSESIQGIMQWDGSSWQAMGTGLSDNIAATGPVMFPHQMMVYNNELYVVGNFRNAGGIEVNGVAKWNGVEWTGMGPGFNNTAYSIAVYQNEIIVGGAFTESNGNTLNRIAKWDGSDWVPLEFGFSQPSLMNFIFVHTLKVINNELFIAGGLKEILYEDNSTEECNGIVSYNGSDLNTYMGGVPDNDIEAVCTYNDQLLIGGGVFGNGYSGITDISIGLHDHAQLPEVSVFPNPFEEEIIIDTDHSFVNYEVRNALGEIIDFGLFNKNLQLNVSPGIYFLMLNDGNKIGVQKIIRK